MLRCTILHRPCMCHLWPLTLHCNDLSHAMESGAARASTLPAFQTESRLRTPAPRVPFSVWRRARRPLFRAAGDGPVYGIFFSTGRAVPSDRGTERAGRCGQLRIVSWIIGNSNPGMVTGNPAGTPGRLLYKSTL